MTGGGFTVDYDALSDMVSVLNGLKDEFEGLEDEMEPYREAAGHDGVSGAMDSFASNWSDDREEIVEVMEQVGEYGQGAADGYRDSDEGLGNEFAQT